MQLKFDDILFFIIIGLIVFVVLWLLHGSPTEIGAITSVGLFAATSELLLWRKFFSMDKNTAVSFVRLKHDIADLKKEINHRLDRLEDLIKKAT